MSRLLRGKEIQRTLSLDEPDRGSPWGCAGTVEIYGEGRKLCEFPRKTDYRLLVDQSHYDGGWDGGNGMTKAPVPLGHLGEQIVNPRSWEVAEPPRRSVERYIELVGAGK